MRGLWLSADFVKPHSMAISLRDHAPGLVIERKT